MVGDHEAAGAIPAIQTDATVSRTGRDATNVAVEVQFLPVARSDNKPPIRGSGHDAAKVVGKGSTPFGGTRVSFYVAVWDGSGFQIRGAVFNSLAACFA